MKDKLNYYINPYLFLKFIDDKLILWDYKNHKQFLLENTYFSRLLDIYYQNSNGVKEIDKELIAENIISRKPYDDKPVWGWDILSHIFHYGTKDVPQDVKVENGKQWAEQYVKYCEELLQKSPHVPQKKLRGKLISLPTPDMSYFKNKNLWETLINRKTCRTFLNKAISLNQLSALLYASFGSVHGSTNDKSEFNLVSITSRKTSPSGGSLHATEIYLAAFNITGLKPGIYHYSATKHALKLISQKNIAKKLGHLLSGQYFAEKLAFGIFMTSCLDKMWWKYKHSRAYRVLLLDIGHLSQTFQLCTTALGLSPWLTNAFLDSEVDKILKIENTNEHTMFFVGAGFSDGSALDPDIKKLLHEEK